MTKAFRLIVLAGFIALNAEAGDNSKLLEMLVKKGVITEDEAAVLAEDANAEFKKSASLLGSLTLKGDLRLRYDHTYDSASNGRSAEDRFRYRFRFRGDGRFKEQFQNGVSNGNRPEHDFFQPDF